MVRCINDHITVAQVKTYAAIMRDLDSAGDSTQAAVRTMCRLLPAVYGGIRPAEISAASIVEVVTATKALHFTMQEIVLPELSILDDEPPQEMQPSLFDEYDEENGYNTEDEEPGNLWDTTLGIIETITHACNALLRMSYTDTMREELVPLIHHLKWEIDHQPEQMKGG